MMVVIVDYGLGNLGSIVNMIKKIGFQSKISSDLEEISYAEKLILPGVGSFDKGIKNLHDLGIFQVLNQKVLVDKTPILGICLGMQLMTKSSEEGSLKGFGWIDAETKRFQSESLKIPHMGWNVIKNSKKSKLFDEFVSEKRFYFVHSYFVDCKSQNNVLTTTPYTHDFVSSFENENVLGVQFHPEKSHNFGLKLLKNFLLNY